MTGARMLGAACLSLPGAIVVESRASSPARIPNASHGARGAAARRSLAGLVLGAVLGGAAPAEALVFVVNDTVDVVDVDPRDGACETAAGGGVCTLRAAIQEANAQGGSHIVILPAGEYRLSIPGKYEGGAATGDLGLRPPEGGELGLDIEGAGADRTIIRQGTDDRVFAAYGRTTVRIAGVTIRDGVARPSGFLPRPDFRPQQGGGILIGEESSVTLSEVVLTKNSVAGGGQAALRGRRRRELRHRCTWTGGRSKTMRRRRSGAGGGILNLGSATLTDVSVIGNRADRDGGGIWNSGTMTMRGVTLRSNRAGNGGGGIANRGDLTLTNVTLSSTGSDVYGSLYNLAGTATLLNVTLYGGTSSGVYTGGIYNAGGIVSLEKSIIASGGTYPNCTGAITSLGREPRQLRRRMRLRCRARGPGTGSHARSPRRLRWRNLDPCPALRQPGRRCGGRRRLPPTDQRGFGRPVDGDADGAAVCDIGAFELQPTARLSVSKAGSGSGRVISTPVGIACGDDCLGVYPIGQLVVLAAGADENSIFVGWSGRVAAVAGSASVPSRWMPTRR